MKFITSVAFVLVLAMSVQCSIIPLGIHQEIAGGGLSYTAVAGPAAVAVLPISEPWEHVHVAEPWNGHAPIVGAPAIEGSYVAKTRGALHAAPLAGHATSVASVNVAPAPGTI